MQVAGTEAAELSMWYAMRAALSAPARTPLQLLHAAGRHRLRRDRARRAAHQGREDQANAGCTSTRNAIITTSAPTMNTLAASGR